MEFSDLDLGGCNLRQKVSKMIINITTIMWFHIRCAQHFYTTDA